MCTYTCKYTYKNIFIHVSILLQICKYTRKNLCQRKNQVFFKSSGDFLDNNLLYTEEYNQIKVGIVRGRVFRDD